MKQVKLYLVQSYEWECPKMGCGAPNPVEVYDSYDKVTCGACDTEYRGKLMPVCSRCHEHLSEDDLMEGFCNDCAKTAGHSR